MPIPEKYLVNFEEGCIYHIYNRTNNKELLFLTDENRRFFLYKFKEILSPFTDVFCWCLLPNHFHFLVRIKTEKSIYAFLQNKQNAELTITEKRVLEQRVANLSKVGNSKPYINFSELIEHSFKRFFQSYALAFNKMHGRRGNLFYKPFKRVKIEKDTQFTMAIVYIHANAVKHGLVKNFTTYPWSSWHSILSNQQTTLVREEVIDWFGSLEKCISAHKSLAAYYYDCEVAIED